MSSEPRHLSPQQNHHMTSEEFRAHGRAVVDWIADYLDAAAEYPVQPRTTPGEVYAALPDAPPDLPQGAAGFLAELDSIIMPGVMHWQSPRFFGYWPANTSGPSILGELLSAGLGVQGMLWSTSPACTELEMRVLDWLVDMLGMPGHFKTSSTGGGVIQDSASSANLCALLAARERASEWKTNDTGLGEAKLTAYVSSEAHSSFAKAMAIAGLGRDNLRLIDVDDRFAMRPDALRRSIEDDIAAGAKPCFIAATVGTTSSGSVDPLRPIGEIAREHDLWLHVDAAHAGTAALCPEHRHIQDGLELVDSYCFNAHKWMFVNFDCDCFYVRDRAALIRTLTILPEYLRNDASESGEVFDYRDWHIPLGRRFRSLKLWLVIRHYGVRGLQHHIRRHIELADMFTRWVRDSEHYELALEPELTLVCFRHADGDDASEQIMRAVNSTGRMFITHTRLNGRFTLRMSIGQTHTERAHVEDAWNILQDAARDL